VHWSCALLRVRGGPSVEGVPKGDVRVGTRKDATGEGRRAPRWRLGVAKSAWIAGGGEFHRRNMGVFGVGWGEGVGSGVFAETTQYLVLYT
jgi:hypothetical protein